MNARKFDFKAETYTPYELPEGACCYSDEMDMPITCAQCGKPMCYGEGYTSRQIHTEHGVGFCVCEKCYEKEWKDEREGNDSGEGDNK
ncbi:hypothetical protein SDC9_159120 [bioreactor metagenome]|uniref:Uncharacterized protein n=1 Tax=bioreactor metagenome TaxID=1076179 RepID=A0A645FEB5_9ZZZZ